MRLNWSVEKGQLISKHAEELGAAKEQALTVKRREECSLGFFSNGIVVGST